MKSLQNQYNLIKEGKGSKEVFTKSAKSIYGSKIPNYYGFNETVKLLKRSNTITETQIGGVIGIKPINSISSDWDAFLKEEDNGVKLKDTLIQGGKELKHDKEVEDTHIKGFDYKDQDNIDNIYGPAFLTGFYTEMNDLKNSEKSVDDLKSIVAKNLSKDLNFYVKDGQFGERGVGYESEVPGLGAGKEAKGKHKSSGYGDIGKQKVSESKKRKKLTLMETLGGDPSLESKWNELPDSEQHSLLLQIRGKREADRFWGDFWENIPNFIKRDLTPLLRGSEHLDEIEAHPNQWVHFERNTGESLSDAIIRLASDGRLNSAVKTWYNDGLINADMMSDVIGSFEEAGVDSAILDQLYDAEMHLNENTKPQRVNPKSLMQQAQEIFGDSVTDIERTEGGSLIVQGNLEDIRRIAQEFNMNIEDVEHWGIRIYESKIKKNKNMISLVEIFEENFKEHQKDPNPLNFAKNKMSQWITKGLHENDGAIIDNTIEEEPVEASLEEQDPTEKSKAPTARKQLKKNVLDSKLKEIEKEGNALTLEAKINAYNEEIAKREAKLGMIDENEDLAELVNPAKLKLMKKEIKELERAKAKFSKMYEKLTGKSPSTPEQVMGESKEEGEDEQDANINK